MITIPNRLAAAIASLEKGEAVDWQLLSQLQSLDIAVAGREYAEAAIKFQDEEDAKLEQLLRQSSSME